MSGPPSASGPYAPPGQPPQGGYGSASVPGPYATQGYPPPGYPAPQQPGGPAPQGYGQPAAPAQRGMFSLMFDSSFTEYATPRLIRFVFILTIIVSIGGWILAVVSALSVPYGAGASAALTLLFGWVPALLSIALVRIALEGVLALVRTAERVTAIDTRAEEAEREASAKAETDDADSSDD